jgi:hypothetical protein
MWILDIVGTPIAESHFVDHGIVEKGWPDYRFLNWGVSQSRKAGLLVTKLLKKDGVFRARGKLVH